MRKKLLIVSGIALTLVVGFLAGRWSTGGPPAVPAGDAAETVASTVSSPEVHPLDPGDPRDRVKYLIEMLASKNPAPVIKRKPIEPFDVWAQDTIEFSLKHDTALQVTVYLALQQLLAEGDAAFDQLLAHTNDKRYSFTVERYAPGPFHTRYNYSVSDACELIVECNVRPFEPELHFLTKGQNRLYPTRDWDPPWAEWWKKNKHRGLASVQIEAIDATMAFMRDTDAASQIPWHENASGYSTDEFNRLRDENLRILKAIRQSIVLTGQPYRPKALHYYRTHILGLSWFVPDPKK